MNLAQRIGQEIKNIKNNMVLKVNGVIEGDMVVNGLVNGVNLNALKSELPMTYIPNTLDEQINTSFSISNFKSTSEYIVSASAGTCTAFGTNGVYTYKAPSVAATTSVTITITVMDNLCVVPATFTKTITITPIEVEPDSDGKAILTQASFDGNSTCVLTQQEYQRNWVKCKIKTINLFKTDNTAGVLKINGLNTPSVLTSETITVVPVLSQISWSKTGLYATSGTGVGITDSFGGVGSIRLYGGSIITNSPYPLRFDFTAISNGSSTIFPNTYLKVDGVTPVLNGASFVIPAGVHTLTSTNSDTFMYGLVVTALSTTTKTEVFEDMFLNGDEGVRSITLTLEGSTVEKVEIDLFN